MGLLDTLSQIVAGGKVSDDNVDQVAQQAPTDVLGRGLSGAFNSEQTPPIGQMVGQLFGNSNGQQQSGMLNQLLATLGPSVAAALAS